MSGTAMQAGTRERDTFVSMLARLDAQLERDLASTKVTKAPQVTEGAEGERTDFVPTLQMLKPEEIAALAAPPRRDAPASRTATLRPARSIGRLLPWLVGGGLVAGAASFAMSFSGSRPVLPKGPEVATIVPVAPVVSAAVAASAPVAVAAVVAAAPAPAPAVVPAPAATVALLQPPAATVAATDSCPPARRALGLCELPTP
jgi:angiomotin